MQEQPTVIDLRISTGEAFKFGSAFALGALLSPFTLIVWGLSRMVTFPVRWWLRRRREDRG